MENACEAGSDNNAWRLQVLDAGLLQEWGFDDARPELLSEADSNLDSCRFEHPSNRNQTSNRGQNRFAPLENDRFGQGGRGKSKASVLP